MPDLGIYYKNEICGPISIHPPDMKVNCLEVGFWPGGAFEKKGVAFRSISAVIPFLAQNLTLKKFKMTTAKENRAARTLVEKLGFQFQKIEKDAEIIHGKSVDHAVYFLPWLSLIG